MKKVKRAVLLVSFCFVVDVCVAQQPASMVEGVGRLFAKIESDITTAAEAMPDSNYSFSPAALTICGSGFKGVRTFAGQIVHIATDNILIWSAITGDSVRADIRDVNGPSGMTAKQEVIAYLKSSFAIGRRAIATLTTQNAMDMMQYRWRKLPRIDLAFYALTHANEHYGQMALYLRMCGIIPPATLTDR